MAPVIRSANLARNGRCVIPPPVSHLVVGYDGREVVPAARPNNPKLLNDSFGVGSSSGAAVDARFGSCGAARRAVA